MVYKFSSTSKISFPGSGIAAIAASRNNLEDIEKQLKFQTIGHDKVNQLRHVRYFKDIHGMVEHMRLHADVMRPKFEAVIRILEQELGGLNIGTWTEPKGCLLYTSGSGRHWEEAVHPDGSREGKLRGRCETGTGYSEGGSKLSEFLCKSGKKSRRLLPQLCRKENWRKGIWRGNHGG